MSKKFKEISPLSREELKKKLGELKKEIIKLDSQVATGTIPKNPSAIRNTKRMIARILMLLGQKGMEEKLSGKKTEVTKA